MFSGYAVALLQMFNGCLVALFVLVLVSQQLWLFNGEVEDSTAGFFFDPLNGTEHGSPPYCDQTH